MSSRFLLILCIALSSFISKAAESSDYLVTAKGDTLYGKVTHAPGELVNFREQDKKVVIYRPFQIRGYEHKGIFYISRIVNETNMFFPIFRREHDDRVFFEEKTNIEVLATGKVTLYYYNQTNHHFVAHSPTSPMMGHSSKTTTFFFDVEDNIGITVSGDWSKELKKALLTDLNVLKENSALFYRVAAHKDKFNKDYVVNTIQEFNQWYATKPAPAE